MAKSRKYESSDTDLEDMEVDSDTIKDMACIIGIKEVALHRAYSRMDELEEVNCRLGARVGELESRTTVTNFHELTISPGDLKSLLAELDGLKSEVGTYTTTIDKLKEIVGISGTQFSLGTLIERVRRASAPARSVADMTVEEKAALIAERDELKLRLETGNAVIGSGLESARNLATYAKNPDVENYYLPMTGSDLEVRDAIQKLVGHSLDRPF